MKATILRITYNPSYVSILLTKPYHPLRRELCVPYIRESGTLVYKGAWKRWLRACFLGLQGSAGRFVFGFGWSLRLVQGSLASGGFVRASAPFERVSRLIIRVRRG